ncbi:MAG TPA: bifunctional adenosylcobinamide kinase/adenosylcobinamide-phosphate guanylyltransferase [Holophagaceae bacterium]|jgi:adenosylcobinamide kinase/adenosylcobinamide-phosphate guanylyltransferase|nr:bifunctional adenosylcobinamide kinase/adenosylcobinamide-phosphate guanylyltransferase [Holophagaceae bacterium]
MGRMVYVTGPVRSGKSRWAVERARAWGEGAVFVATYRPNDDADMDARIQRHRDERPGWRTLEAPRDIAAALSALDPAPSGALLDCQTLWLSDRLDLGDEALLSAWGAQLAAFKSAPWPVVIVGNEVGWSPVPESALARRFRDLAGWLGQRSAAAADEAWLLVAGCPLRLK